MSEIVLHQFAPMEGVDSGSPFCTKVHRALGCKGLSYSVNNVRNPGELKSLNPGRAKLPVLRFNGNTVVDSTAILEFLDEKVPAPPLYPAAGIERARVRLLEDWADESLYWFVVYQRWNMDAPFKVVSAAAFGALPPPLRWFVPGVVRGNVQKQLRGQGLGRLQPQEMFALLSGHLDALDALLAESPHLAGPELSAADLAVFGPMQALFCAWLPESREMVEAHANLVSWLHRVDEKTRGEHAAPVV